MPNRTPLVLAALCLGLTACNPQATSIAKENKNPLVAMRYSDDLANGLANLVIQNDPLLKEEGAREQIDAMIEDAKQIGVDARIAIASGMQGAFIAQKESVTGWALLAGDTLYFSSDFEVRPGPNLHVYLTTVPDPNEVEFPDSGAIDVGEIQSVYGAQQYALTNADKMRTVVLYDKTFKRLYGFAQLSER